MGKLDFTPQRRQILPLNEPGLLPLIQELPIPGKRRLVQPVLHKEHREHSNGLVGVSGALYAQYQGSADVNMGRGAIVIGLAAVIIGEVVFGKIFHNFALRMLAAVIGAIIYFIVIAIVLQLGLSTNDLKLFSALIVALFLAIPYLKGRYFASTARKGGRADA